VFLEGVASRIPHWSAMCDRPFATTMVVTNGRECVSLDSTCVLLQWLCTLLQWLCTTTGDCVSLDSSCVLLQWLCTVIHQFAQAGFSEELPENEQSVLIFAEFRVQPVL
jgi:hypothetical protein